MTDRTIQEIQTDIDNLEATAQAEEGGMFHADDPKFSRLKNLQKELARAEVRDEQAQAEGAKKDQYVAEKTKIIEDKFKEWADGKKINAASETRKRYWQSLQENSIKFDEEKLVETFDSLYGEILQERGVAADDLPNTADHGGSTPTGENSEDAAAEKMAQSLNKDEVDFTSDLEDEGPQSVQFFDKFAKDLQDANRGAA